MMTLRASSVPEKGDTMNYWFLGGRWLLKYAYVDMKLERNYVADSLFYRRRILVHFEEEMVREGDKYRIIFVRIRRKYKQEFEKALGEIENKMSLLGHNDYGAYCEMLAQCMDPSDECCLRNQS